MTLKKQLEPFHRNPVQTGLGLSLITVGLLISWIIIGELFASGRFNGAAVLAIIATAIIATGILTLDAIRCSR